MTISAVERDLPRLRAPSVSRESVALPATASSAALARTIIQEHTALDSMRRTEADLLVTELIGNAVLHAPDADRLELIVDGTQPRTVRISVAHPHPSPLDDPEPGVGFKLLERLSHAWGHEHDGTRLEVWFTLRKPGSISAAPDLEDTDLADVLASDASTLGDALVRRHRDLAMAIARRYRGKGIADEDLEQVAMMGLVKAINRYDGEKGDLRPYAAVTISGELKRWLRDKGWSVRVPRSVQEMVLAAAKASDELSQRLGREPTVDEMAEHLDIDPAEVMESAGARLAYSSRSIEKQSTGTEWSLLDSLEDEASTIKEAEDRLLLEEAISKLPERQRLIMGLRFNDDMSQTEIARVVGVSQVHVSRLLSGALGSLRELLSEDA